MLRPKAFPADEYREIREKQGDTVLAKEWNTLNSGLLKQLFDRHYVLWIKEKRREHVAGAIAY